MLEINYFAVIVAAIVAFFVGAIWNSVFADILLEARGAAALAGGDGMPLGQMGAELARVTVMALVLAMVLKLAGVTDLFGALRFAFLAWLGLQAALLAGAVIWEAMPPKLYAVHVGDALVKTMLTAAIIAFWR